MIGYASYYTTSKNVTQDTTKQTWVYIARYTKLVQLDNMPTFVKFCQVSCAAAGLPRKYLILPTFKFSARWQQVTMSLSP